MSKIFKKATPPRINNVLLVRLADAYYERLFTYNIAACIVPKRLFNNNTGQTSRVLATLDNAYVSGILNYQRKRGIKV